MRQVSLRSFPGYNTWMSAASGFMGSLGATALSKQNLICPDSNIFSRNEEMAATVAGNMIVMYSQQQQLQDGGNSRRTEEMSQLERRGKHTQPFARRILSSLPLLLFESSSFFFFKSQNSRGGGFKKRSQYLLPISLLTVALSLLHNNSRISGVDWNPASPPGWPCHYLYY